jgi:phosphoribosyl 1,2-cyclic phosphodiesterase
MLRFISFGSGSSGNCYLLECDGARFLVDSGIGIRRLLHYLRQYAVSPESIQAILLTHDHLDHTRSAECLAAKYDIPIYATALTWQGIMNNPAIPKKSKPELRHAILKNQTYDICKCHITPFEVPHDSQDCAGYFIAQGTCTLCIVTDCGQLTPTIDQYISQAHNLVLEANYDPQMLREGPYPYQLKKRISSAHGHLSNLEAAQIISAHASHLAKVWLCHLSEHNNTPQIALEIVENLLQQSDISSSDLPEVHVLKRTEPSVFFDLD